MSGNKLVFVLLFSTFGSLLYGHPSGSMIAVGDKVYWSYVSPMGDIDHHACIMVWDQKGKPKELLVSAHPASDFILSPAGNDFYALERRHNSRIVKSEARLLHINSEGISKEVWPWFVDEWNIGIGGFFMLNESEMVFANHPGIYKMNKGAKPYPYFEFQSEVSRIKQVPDGKLLLFNRENCWLTDVEGNELKSWKNLADPYVESAPLDRNIIFDVDYKNDELLIAYWGGKKFELIDKTNQKRVIKVMKSNYVPHWVAFLGNKKLLFSSYLDFDNPFNHDKSRTTIAPLLLLYSDFEFNTIWME